jgi:hypothetical protein
MNQLAILFVVALGLCMQARFASAQEEKNLSDDEIAKRIVGKWRFEAGPKEPTLKITMSFAKDHKCATEAESLDVNKVRHVTKASGTWKVEKGAIVVTTEKSTDAKDVGKVNRTRVVSVDGSMLKVVVTFTPDAAAPAKEFKQTFEFKKVK